MTALLEYLDLTALLEYIDLLNRYSGGPSWGLLGPLSGWGPGQNAPVAPPPVGGPDTFLIGVSIQYSIHISNLYYTYCTCIPEVVHLATSCHSTACIVHVHMYSV